MNPAAPPRRELPPERFNDTAHDFPHDSCLPDLLRASAQAGPGRIAVVDGDERLSLRELTARSEQVAAHLHALGVQADDCLGVFVEPSADLMVGVWGILLSGAAYLPLSPEYPAERLRHMIGDRRAAIILTQEHLRARLEQLAPAGTRIVTVADASSHAPPPPGRDVPHAPAAPRPRDLAYVLYTSGSTGAPKAVMIEHRSIVNQMHWLHTVHGLGADTVVVQKTPMSFDAAQWEILAPAYGCRVVMAAPGEFRDPERLVDTIVRHGVTTLQCVPTLLQALLDTERLSGAASLRRLFCGGEALSRSLAARCVETLPSCTLVNLYGPTECTINTSAFTVDPRAVREGPETVPIGRPVHNTRYHILDEAGAPVAVGEVGELHIGGVQLARGYAQRPESADDRFIDHPQPHGCGRLYRTGDLAHWHPDGTVQFVGRRDNQVKLRGFRIELDEIKHAIETHDWVRHAAVVVGRNARTDARSLVAFIELNPREAALMDQGNHGRHHQSKQDRLQARAQLSDPGCRDVEEIAGKPVVDLPGREPTAAQRREVFARKTYRFFEGGATTKDDILRLLGRLRGPAQRTRPRRLDELGLAELGTILRYFGQFHSEERLLAKYGYASPGALYATQMYLELRAIAGVADGHYYYHPARHELILVDAAATDGGDESAAAAARIHFVGRRRAIAPVYANNIREVLEIEAGHMVGLFEEVLPRHGMTIRPRAWEPSAMRHLQCAADDHYLGTFELAPGAVPSRAPECDIYVQSHPNRIADLPAGQYRYRDGELVRVCDELVLQRHVIAINQQVYERASFAMTAVSTSSTPWRRYIDLGRTLQRLSMNDRNLGFMSSGYSSKSGDPLPSAKRIDSILAGRGIDGGPSYFFVGGRVSDAQVRSEGMKEDAVHMKGPTELIRDDLRTLLPEYMMPSRVVVLDALPTTVNGKLDTRALEHVAASEIGFVDRPRIAPRTFTERRIAVLWRSLLKQDDVCVTDDFFECGGNSLIAVALMNEINLELRGGVEATGDGVPVQALFEAPTIERLAARVDAASARRASRLVRLHADGSQPPIYCWPGLGGYPLSLRALAHGLDVDRPFYGVQAHGLNAGETPFPTLAEMAAADVALIRRRQPHGPYTLWGYSFGARVAFEAAHQLERAGEHVHDVVLVAPGLPKLAAHAARTYAGRPSYADEAYVTILFSVFAGTVDHPALAECLATVRDDESFADFVSARFDIRDAALVRRIVRVVRVTSQFRYASEELAARRLRAPLTICRARGDEHSFIELAIADGWASVPHTVIDLDADHYRVLKEPDVAELVAATRPRLALEMQAA